MALIKCKECNTTVSDKADTCPKCGCPIHNKHKFSTKRTLAMVAGASLIFILIVMLYALNLLNTTNPPTYVPGTELQIYEDNHLKLNPNQSYSIQLDITQKGTLNRSCKK